MSPVSNIVIGRRPSSTMVQIAHELRRNMTIEEKILWEHLRANRLSGFHFRRQQIIDRYVVDFYCHAAALVIEVDGEIHNQQVEQDAERDANLNACGLMVLRFKNQEVHNNLANVLARIVAECK
jgi:very-short-patch-repair endonuclease